MTPYYLQDKIQGLKYENLKSHIHLQSLSPYELSFTMISHNPLPSPALPPLTGMPLPTYHSG